MVDRAILEVTGELSFGGAEYPSNLHVKIAERAKQYLFNTRTLGLAFGGIATIQPFICIYFYQRAIVKVD